jgi:serine/threonine protein kinase
MHCWLDCLAYTEIKSLQFRCTKAIEIYNYYVSKASPMFVEVLQESARQIIMDNMRELMKNLEEMDVVESPRTSKSGPGSLAKDNSFTGPAVEDLDLSKASFDKLNYKALSSDNFNALSNAAFRHLVNSVLFNFKMSSEYALFKEELKREDAMSVGLDIKRRKCRIFVDDFQYIRLLGKGGFARVVHVMKRSTKQHYAMKIQSKVALVKFHGMNEGGLELEKTMIANNRNPFIVDLHYSLQTDLTAILVLGLVGGGDLSDIIFTSPKKRLPEELAKIYTYEIGFALNHLHENGVVYRDLKPANVLVDDSGHLKLTDMGLAAPMYVYEGKKAGTGGEDNIKDDGDSTSREKADSTSAIETAMAEGMQAAEDAPGVESVGVSAVSKLDAAIGDAAADRKARGSLGFQDETNTSSNKESGANGSGSDEGAKGTSTPASDAGGSLRSRQARGSLDSVQENGYDYGGIESVPQNPWELETDKKPIRRKSIVGTRAYLAPEMLEQTFEQERSGYTKKVDYFALGVTVFEMCAGRRPWHDFEPGKGNRSSEIADPFAMDSDNLMKIIQLRQDRKKFPPGFISKLHKVEFPDFFSANLCDLIQNLLERDPEKRFDFEQVKAHKWMDKIDVKKLLDKDASVIPNYIIEGIKNRKNKFLAESMEGDEVMARYKHFEDLMAELKQKDRHHSKLSWGAETVLTDDAQKLFADWDYMSPEAIKFELGMYGYEHDPKLKAVRE